MSSIIKFQPSITVGLPFFNAEDYLFFAIQSVLKQSFKDFKLILLDDGSTDTSLEIAHQFAEQDSRITVLSDGENRALSYRLNQLIDLCDTPFLARMDADDIMLPSRLEAQLKIMEAHRDIDVLGTNAYTIDAYNNVQGIRINTDFKEFEILPSKGFIHPSIMVKTSWYKENKYDVNMKKAQDFELWQRTGAHSTFRIYTEPLLFYREVSKGYYKKYFMGINSKFRNLKKSPDIFHFLNFIRYLFTALLYRIFNLFNWETKLVNKRSHPLDEKDLAYAKNILNSIIL